MSSTFTTPIRIFKRNNPSNDGTIAPDNTGVSSASQQSYITNPITATSFAAGTFTTADVGSTTATAFVVPAGSMITNVRLYQTTAAASLSGGVITVSLVTTSTSDGTLTTTTVGTITPTAAGGVISWVPTATAAAAVLLNNIGLLDATLTFTYALGTLASGSVSGTFDVSYVPRNVDGSISAYGSGLTNS